MAQPVIYFQMKPSISTEVFELVMSLCDIVKRRREVFTSSASTPEEEIYLGTKRGERMVRAGLTSLGYALNED
ncbi:hypothetical protein BH09PAT2_BH09PAT2_04550 [soil metagenome]